MTLEQLAALTPHPKAGQQTDLSLIGKLERGTLRLTHEWMERVASGLGVSPDELIANPAYQPVRRVPLIGKIAAGRWREAIEDPIALIPFAKGGPNTFALEPEGDSMDKVVPNGGTVFVDPDEKELVDGKYYAIINTDGDTTFKQFRLAPPRLEPCSTNSSHEAMLLGAEPWVTLGRVVGMHSDL